MSQRDALAIFVRVAEMGSFRQAADSLGMTSPAVSNAVQRLEERLDVRLLHRSTRGLTLTEDGTRLLATVAPALEAIATVESELREGRNAPRGRLRLTVPVSFGRLVLAPLLPKFLDLYPDVDVDVTVTDRIVDLVGESVDLAFRFGPLPASTLMTRVVWRNRRVTVASPGYLRSSPGLLDPADLHAHRCLGFAPPGVHTLPWRFKSDTDIFEMRPPFRVTADQIESLVETAVSGGGVLQTLGLLVAPHLRARSLQLVLEPWGFEDRPVLMVWSSQRNIPAKVRVFIDWASSEIAATAVAGTPAFPG
jgi:LysR family transcriptional regulator, regulator for bpeEF and oprC